MTYMLKGEQHLVVAVGGGNYSGELIAFKLPASGNQPRTAAPISSAAPAPAPGLSRSLRDGVFTKEQADRGESFYKQSCAGCHGGGLEGADMSPALAGGAFLDKRVGQTLGDLFERIRTTMPNDRPGRLSRDINADITAFILSANEYPAGTTQLVGDAQALKQVQISAKK